MRDQRMRDQGRMQIPVCVHTDLKRNLKLNISGFKKDINGI